MKRHLPVVVLALVVPACKSSAPPPASAPSAEVAAEGSAEAAAPFDVEDVDLCAACHAEVVSEWRSSMHAQAHHSRDPIYAAMRELRMARQGEQVANRCASCHHPRERDALDGPVAAMGVSCATCHQLEAVDPTQRGHAGLTFATDPVFRGPNGPQNPSAAPHGVGPAAPWLNDGQSLCLTCHGSTSNPAGVPTCTTGAEHDAAPGDATCTSCHMPQVDGPNGVASTRASHRSHAFLGPHGLYHDAPDTAFMASAAEVSLTFEGDALVARVDNRAHHALPTGFPGRVMRVVVRATNAAGEVVFTNADAADATFTKVYGDAEGNPTMPPFSTQLLRDTRLTPGESRALRWDVPADAVSAEARLVYRLLPPPAATALGVDALPIAEPRVITTVTATRE